MASDSLFSGLLGSSGTEAGTPDSGALESLISGILGDCLENIVHDEVLSVHREEKVARGRSAAIIGEQQAAQEGPGQNGANNVMTSPTVGSGVGKATTPGGIYEDGKFSLVGNPLVTTRETLCPRCRLPRLFEPTTGKGGVIPDSDKQHCTRHPPIDKPGHDIWGNPFFHVGGAKAKKDKKIAKAQADKMADGDAPNGTPPDAEKTKPVSTTIPSVKCPNGNCTRYLMVHRIANHLATCMGISGRNASRDAKARMGASGTNGTPYGSRMGTPTPDGRKVSPKQYQEDDEDDEEDADTPKKKKKKIVKKGQNLKAKRLQEDLGKIIPGLKERPDKNLKQKDREDSADAEIQPPTQKKMKSTAENGNVPPRSSLLKQSTNINGTSGPKDGLEQLKAKPGPAGEEKKDKPSAKEGGLESTTVSKKKDSGGGNPEGIPESSRNDDSALNSKKKHEIGTPAQAVEV